MKIGVLTYHKSHNYGAFLQAYALTSFLRKKGYDCELINYNMKIAEDTYRPKEGDSYEFDLIKYNMFNKCLKMLPLSNFIFKNDDITNLSNEIDKKYDILIVGSDEVWKTDGIRGFPNIYWLPNKTKAVKLAYAVSSRSELSKLNVKQINELEKYINDFKYIGLRDEYSINQVSKYCKEKSKIHLTCDPTFLYDFNVDSERGKKILIDRYKIDINKKTILLMTNNNILVKLVNKLFKKRANIISIFYRHKDLINTPELTPFELLDVIKYSDLLITSFFHGMCFAIQNNTNFIADDFREKSKRQSKIYDLLKREHLLKQFISKHNIFYIIKMIFKCKQLLYSDRPDYSKIVENERNSSKTFFEYMKTITIEE